MTQEEFSKLSNTDRAFLKLEGRCAGCGCALNGMFIAHASWCSVAPRVIFNPGHEWGKHSGTIIQTSRRQGKSVLDSMVKEINKLFGKENENTNR